MNTVIKPSNLRAFVINIMDRCRKHSLMVSLNIKVDMTKVLEKKKITGFSFYTILSKAISDVIKANPRYKIINSVFIKRYIRSRLIVFEHHHFSYTFPKVFQGEEMPITYVINNVDQLSAEEIDKRIQQASKMPIEDFPSYPSLKIMSRIPDFFQKILLFIYDFLNDPKERDGSICINNIGKTFVNSFIAESSRTVIFSFPGIDQNNESLLTLTINHYVIDGKLTCAFADDLKKKLESL